MAIFNIFKETWHENSEEKTWIQSASGALWWSLLKLVEMALYFLLLQPLPFIALQLATQLSTLTAALAATIIPSAWTFVAEYLSSSAQNSTTPIKNASIAAASYFGRWSLVIACYVGMYYALHLPMVVALIASLMVNIVTLLYPDDCYATKEDHPPCLVDQIESKAKLSRTPLTTGHTSPRLV